MLRAQGPGLPVCVSVCHLDGLVVSRSAFTHSINFRSAMAFGRAALVEDEAVKRAALAAFVERIYPGRMAEVRPPSEAELKQTAVVEMTIEEAAAKVRSDGVARIDADADWTAWSGVIPLSTMVGARVADAVQSAGAVPSPSLAAFVETARLDEVLFAAKG
jgi:hypothetical protein